MASAVTAPASTVATTQPAARLVTAARTAAPRPDGRAVSGAVAGPGAAGSADAAGPGAGGCSCSFMDHTS
jgi:hypothetical protein